MKVNYDFYSGKDEYTDGDVEKEIIEYLNKYGEENYDEIFKKDIKWPIFYHISPIRKNVLNWYPFKNDSEVLEIGAGLGAITSALCEKAKFVTSVELSKQRAEGIQARCKNRDNLEIIVGNLNDIDFGDRKFDYITLIGVFEYAPLYTQTQDPFNDFLTKIKKLLKEDGKLLIAIENQFGMKYFTGAIEDHTSIPFDGITGYKNTTIVKTFGKEELKNILVNNGFKYTKFYYPLPDYKLPNKIFSENYLPTLNDIEEYTPYLSKENEEVLYNEKDAYKDIIKNNQFEFFANSFFVEASSSVIDTEVDLRNQQLLKIDNVMKKFYDTHYRIKENNSNTTNDEIYRLKEENDRLKYELAQMANSKSWKITKPLRNFTSKKRK